MCHSGEWLGRQRRIKESNVTKVQIRENQRLALMTDFIQWNFMLMLKFHRCNVRSSTASYRRSRRTQASQNSAAIAMVDGCLSRLPGDLRHQSSQQHTMIGRGLVGPWLRKNFSCHVGLIWQSDHREKIVCSDPGINILLILFFALELSLFIYTGVGTSRHLSTAAQNGQP